MGFLFEKYITAIPNIIGGTAIGIVGAMMIKEGFEKNENEDQLKELPEEFIVEMEQQKADRWVDVYDFIKKYFNCEEVIAETEAEGFPLEDFFKRIHDFGFYGGVNFALDPQEPYIIKSKTHS